MAVCPTLTSGDAFLSTLLIHIDCQARGIGSSGYQALAEASSPVSLVVTGLLTIFVALFGLRMMFGEAPTIRSVIMAVVKIGVVLTLAGSWSAYRTVVYDVVVDGPAQIVSLIGRPTELPGADGDLIRRLQGADDGIVRLTNSGTGREEFAALPTSEPGAQAQRFPIADNSGFGWGRVLFLTATTAAFAIVRLTAGVLLALAPLFAGLLLFDLARGLVVGWARTLAFTVLASVAVTIILGVQLALLEPWLAQTLAQRQGQAVAPSAPVELLVLSLVFAATLLGAIGVLLRLAFMISIPNSMRQASLAPDPQAPEAARPVELAPVGTANRQETARPVSRALAIADSVAAAQRRETSRLQVRSAAPSTGTLSLATAGGQASGDLAIPTYGQALRRAKPRKSLSAAIRDRRT